MIHILNGSPRANGNCARLCRRLAQFLSDNKEQSSVTTTLALAGEHHARSVDSWVKLVDGLVFVTGTYWDSWGWPLQRLLDAMGEQLEGSPVILGKPAAVVVLEHSCGGKGVLSRLQGVLSSMGFLIPPMSGLVLSEANDALFRRAGLCKDEPVLDDLWAGEDLLTVCHNLVAAMYRMEGYLGYRSWRVGDKSVRDWFNQGG